LENQRKRQFKTGAASYQHGYRWQKLQREQSACLMLIATLEGDDGGSVLRSVSTK
jgi:hypothetical protein